MATQTAFASLFYGKSHGEYQELLLRDMCMRRNIQEQVKSYTEFAESLSLTCSGTNGQGVDFLQEEANREMKSLFACTSCHTTEHGLKWAIPQS